MRPSSAELSPGGWGGVGRADWRPGRTMKRFTEKRVVSREDWKPGRRGERGGADEEQGGGRGSRQARWRRSRCSERRRRRVGDGEDAAREPSRGGGESRRRAGGGEDAVFQPPRTSRHGPPEPRLPGPAFPPRPAQPCPVGWRMGRAGRTRSSAGLSEQSIVRIRFTIYFLVDGVPGRAGRRGGCCAL